MSRRRRRQKLDNITTTSPGVRVTYEETAKAKLQKLLANSNRAYEEFEKAQKELGEYLCSLMREVIPSISFELGDYDMGIDLIRFTLPEEELEKREHLFYREEREDECHHLDIILFDVLKELGIEKGEHIWFESDFYTYPEETRKLEQLLREKLGGDK